MMMMIPTTTNILLSFRGSIFLTGLAAAHHSVIRRSFVSTHSLGNSNVPKTPSPLTPLNPVLSAESSICPISTSGNVMALTTSQSTSITQKFEVVDLKTKDPMDIISTTNHSNLLNRVDSEYREYNEPLNLFGLKFQFDGVRFKLNDLDYTPSNLLTIAKNIDDCFITINRKGYIPNNLNLNQLFIKIHDYLKSLGYKSDKSLGSNENTFTL